MLSLTRKGPGWEIFTANGSVELAESQARAIALRILAAESDPVDAIDGSGAVTADDAGLIDGLVQCADLAIMDWLVKIVVVAEATETSSEA